ncbi:NucA/NucB deoxyribonuclease domain-containing protein [Gottfriedia acidiceleris]|uniref:NucA/NucB deoxyribonuclease domain-containing protein n=1 Tax=Gottfriedia acidiceleris TaxID=371036 RepID=A0ABY4JIS2_9BACI|nr:NucA/NucB deoxyribonuclease domain-containing protein [Gottfriedia acidiceleris]UPM52652.1 NucA/NucB deoxyribonuclease domain-containing protein [Gottfriedia acidiceleris]
MKNRFVKVALTVGILTSGFFGVANGSDATTQKNDLVMYIYVGGKNVKTYNFPDAKYPESAKHWKDALRKGESNFCTIKRGEAEYNRSQSLKGIKTKKGYDRDEFPFAMCDEGGKGADVRLIHSSDNRGSGASVGNTLRPYKNGTKVKFVIK